MPSVKYDKVFKPVLHQQSRRKKGVLGRVPTAQSRHVDTQQVRHTTWYAAAAICNFFAFLNAFHLMLFNIFCLQLAPVPEKDPGSAQHSLVLV